MLDGADLLAAGWTALRSGRSLDAERLARQATTSAPTNAQVWFFLGVVLQNQGGLAAATECYKRSLELRPHYVEALINLGSALRGLGRAEEATTHLRLATRLRPECSEAHYNLGNAFYDLKQPIAAIECFQDALRLRPVFPEANNNLGNTLRDQGRFTEALVFYARAADQRPNYRDALLNKGYILRRLGRLVQCAECYQRVIDLFPDQAEMLVNLGDALRALGKPGPAEIHLRHALAIKPQLPEAHYNLGLVLRELGQVDEAISSSQRAMELRPAYIAAHDALLYTLHYRPAVTPSELASAQAEYQRSHAESLRATWRPHDNDRDPNRPLRIGFVSGDFRRHPVGLLTIRGLEMLARRYCTIVCYSNCLNTDDEYTARFRSIAKLWRDAAEYDDEHLAQRVRTDEIDVLIDLAGHTGSNRLLTFARKPAPVQMTWLGYEGTTGVEAIDYFIADERLVPYGAENHYHESVVRLSGGYACYDVPIQAPKPDPPPVLTTGHVTFGCFNNPAKLSAPALCVFADVLRRTPNSRLLMQYRGLDDPLTAERITRILLAEGIEPSRIQFNGALDHTAYLASYSGVDVALDPFPFGGGITTCDALWMGVPVVTLPGATFASRHGLSYLTAAGLEWLAAKDVNDYVTMASELAQDQKRLVALRENLRGQVATSPLCNGDRLADQLLDAIQCAWREWATSSKKHESCDKSI